jgi:hypothetical protein
MDHPTKQQLLEKGFIVVGSIDGYEWVARKREDGEVLYHVLKDDVSLYRYPQCLSPEQIKGALLLADKFSIKM